MLGAARTAAASEHDRREAPEVFAPPNRYAKFDGDSRAFNGQSSPIPTAAIDVQRILNGGMEHWVQLAAANRFMLLRNAALGGDDTQEWLDNREEVLISGAGGVFDTIGANDGMIPLEQTKANRLRGMDDVIAMGGINFANTDLPWTDIPGGVNGVGAQEHLAYVRWLQSGAPKIGRKGKVHIFDTFAAALKAGTVMDYIDGYSGDGLHMVARGNRAVGTAWGEAIKSDPGIIWPGDHPAPLPIGAGGTINSNPMMTGTNGTKGSGVHAGAVVATQWRIDQFNMSPAVVTGGKDVDPDGYDRQRVIISGTPSIGANPSVTLYQSSNLSGVALASLVPGTRLRAVARIHFADPDVASRFYAAGSVGIRVVGNIAGVAHTVQRINGYQSPALGHLEQGYDYPDGVMTPDLVIPEGMTVTSAFFEIACAFGQNQPADGWIGVSRAAWRVVP